MSSAILDAIILRLCVAVLSLQAANAAKQGNTIMESYSVNTTIESRFARTDIVAIFSNERNCSTLRGFTMQLPSKARVRGLRMTLSDGCVINSEVASEFDARQSFESKVAEGKPAAMLTAWDSANYGVEVSIPPNGTTLLEVHYEELLIRRQHEVEFQLPLSPGVEVERLEVDVVVNEPQTGVSMFSLDDPGYGNFDVARGASSASGHLELHDVQHSVLPRLLRGTYDTDDFPENGILMADGYGCATLLFNPTSFLQSGSMPRKMVFVIDVSGSMSGQKLSDAKAAFSSMISTLAAVDHFSIHSFSDSGTASLFGPRVATSDAKSDAIAFVNGLVAGGGTNLDRAYSDGLDRVALMQQKDEDLEFVPVLVILTDGQATTGVTESKQISLSVRTKNDSIGAKIFALAFGFGADLSLLRGISIQNGGVAVPIYEGYGDAAQQMEGFYLGELGEILMSDVEVNFGGDFGIMEQTQSNFPVFARGTEIVARAMVAGGDYSQGILQATTVARTVVGERVWNTELDMETNLPTPNSECAIGLAMSRIDSIMQFHEGALSLGDDMVGYEPYTPNGKHEDKAAESKEEALKLALEAGVVWPGLTAMVTVEGSHCAKTSDNITDVCTDGDSSDSEEFDFTGGSGGSTTPFLNSLVWPVSLLLAFVLRT